MFFPKMASSHAATSFILLGFCALSALRVFSLQFTPDIPLHLMWSSFLCVPIVTFSMGLSLLQFNLVLF